ncbi:MAG: hypothetical protein IPK23_00350 [Rhizobiales bacterium]|jgi:hypothetical protein|nr:hypothetical protein [Hyphomicrobiales bacterium]
MIRFGFLAIATLLFATSASAESLNAKQARAFVAGKLFSYQCFDGTTGVGRINNDGSAAGTIRIAGKDPTRYVRLPVNTLYESGQQICATLKGLPFTPCFNLTKTSEFSFRGAVSGMGFMYCDFSRGGRPTVTKRTRSPQATTE